MIRLNSDHPSNLIRTVRRIEELTQAQFAARLGMSQSAAARRERPDNNAPWDVVVGIFDAMGYDVSIHVTRRNS